MGTIVEREHWDNNPEYINISIKQNGMSGPDITSGESPEQ